jgi:hypothetical protein
MSIAATILILLVLLCAVLVGLTIVYGTRDGL